MGDTRPIIGITQRTSVVEAVNAFKPRGHECAQSDLLGRKNVDVTSNIDIPTAKGWHIHNGYVEAKVRVGSCERPACGGNIESGTTRSVGK